MKHIRLSMQLIYEEFQKSYKKITFQPGSDSARLEGFRIYKPGTLLSPDYIYLLLDPTHRISLLTALASVLFPYSP